MSSSSVPLLRNGQALILNTARPGDLPEVVECSVAAFTRFAVFGPPWDSDAGVLPAMLLAVPGVIIRVARDAASGAIVGVAVWVPSRIRLSGKSVPAAFLAPLAVRPEWQGQGVGALLMRDGMALMREQAVRLLYLLGHADYYRRFGFSGECFGRHALSIPMPPPIVEDLAGHVFRPLAAGDESACTAWWSRLSGGVDGACEPGDGLLPWFSKTRGIVSCVLERAGLPVAHARFNARPGSCAANGILRFLACDGEAARVLAGRIVAWTGWSGDRLGIPLSSRSPAVRALFPSGGLQAEEEWWPPAMAVALGDDALEDVLRRIRLRELPPLMIEWSPLFDL